MLDQPVHRVAGVRRVRDDRIGRAVIVEFKRILTVPNVARISAAQLEGFQDGAPARRHRSTARRTSAPRAGVESAVAPRRTASGRSPAGSARNWNACPCCARVVVTGFPPARCQVLSSNSRGSSAPPDGRPAAVCAALRSSWFGRGRRAYREGGSLSSLPIGPGTPNTPTGKNPEATRKVTGKAHHTPSDPAGPSARCLTVFEGGPKLAIWTRLAASSRSSAAR